MLEAMRMAFPRSLDRRGLTLKSKTMSLTTRSMRDLELSTFCIVPHCFFSSSFCQSFNPFVLASNQASILSSEPSRWSMNDWRSEEHTSELQSRVDLVCRL